MLNSLKGSMYPRARDASLRRLISHSLVALSIASTTACSNPFGGGDCISLGVFGVAATVVDASTTLAPNTPPSMRLADGAYVENVTGVLQGTNPVVLSGAVERPGTYEATFEALGYETVVRRNIQVVRSGRCNYLQPVQLDVEMVRAR